MAKEQFYNFDKDITQTIIQNIIKYRKAKGYTQEQLALMAEICYDFMKKIETGKSGFSIQTLYKISVVLETGVDKLLEK